MKGLIYKDFILTKKHIILGFMYFFIAISILFMIRLSMDYGNIAKMDTRDALLNNMFIFRYVPAVIILIDLAFLSLFTLNSDAISGWNKYCFSGPVTNKMIVGERYMFPAILLLMGFIAGSAYVLLFSVISGDGFNLNMLRNIMIIFLVAVCYVYTALPLYIIVTDKRKRNIIITALGIIAYIGSMVYTFSLIKEIDGQKDIELLTYLRERFTPSMNAVFIVLAAAAALIIPLGYILSNKLMKRGEE